MTATATMVIDLVWLWYLLTVSAAALLFARGTPDGSPWLYAAIHLVLAAVVLIVRRALAGRSDFVRHATRGVFALVGLPIVFASMALVLPAVHPEPYEWLWIATDRAILGVDPTIALQALLVPWFTELLQWVYAAFYLIPVVTIAVIGLRRGIEAFGGALLAVVFGFLFSYLGYFLWPTLPPCRFLPYDVPIEGVWWAAKLHAAVDAAETHHWDCFPSGHTMLSIVCLVLAWRSARGLFWSLLPVVGLLILSTMVLRYHYFVDVVAGALLVTPSVLLSDSLFRADR